MKKQQIAAVVVFCGFLAAVALGYLLPGTDFSEMEKRFLAKKPVLTWDSLFSGTWSKGTEEYLSDHVAGRNLFVGINAYLERLAGRQHLKDIWAEEGKLLEAPAPRDDDAIARNLRAINSLSETLNQKVHLMIVPSAGWAAGVDGYTDSDSIDAAYAEAGANVVPVSVTEIFRGRPELYYNTDHHWTSQGAYLGYEAFAAAAGREVRPADAFEVKVVDGFQGSTFSRSALWLTPSEPVELWQGSSQITVTNGENPEPHDGIFYMERLEEADKYTVFLDGNHSIVRISNPECTGKLLVIRDSYSNCLGGFLAESYGEVVLVDLRYYRQPVSVLVTEEGFDDILVCYNSANFLTDTNLMLLR